MKGMDIRTAFNLLNSRKRKATESSEANAKIPKLSELSSDEIASIDDDAITIDLTEDEESGAESSKNAIATSNNNQNHVTDTVAEKSPSKTRPIDVHQNENANVSLCKHDDANLEETISSKGTMSPKKGINDSVQSNAEETLFKSPMGTGKKRKARNLDTTNKVSKISLKNLQASEDEASTPKQNKSVLVTEGSTSDEETKSNRLKVSSSVIEDPHETSEICSDDNDTDSSKLDSSFDTSGLKECDVSNLNSSFETSSLKECDLSDLNSSFNTSGLRDCDTSDLNSSFNETATSVNEGDSKTSSQKETDKSRESSKENVPKRTKRISSTEMRHREEKKKQKELLRQQAVAKKADQRRLLKEEKELERLRVLKEKQIRKEREEMEKQEREKVKLEKKEHEEQRKQKEREEKQKEKEEKNRAKQLILEGKAEEKRKKEEERLRVVEEKKQAEEEKKRIQIEKIEKEKKAKEALMQFFVKSGFSISSQPQVQAMETACAPLQVAEVTFKPFQVTEGMALAPVVPSAAQQRFDKIQLDQLMKNQSCDVLYLSQLKMADYKSICHKKAKKASLDDDNEDVMVMNDVQETGLNVKGKLFQFHENLRPAYWGTWRKRSSKVKPCKPFAQDEVFDYDVDSDEEWDEGGPGESLTGTEDEESEDDYEVDNEFFVPHGYLSAEEEGEDEEPADPDAMKARLKLKEREFLMERKKKMIELKPVIFGCFFELTDVVDVSAAEKFLKPYSAELLTSKEILTAATFTNQNVTSTNVKESPSAELKRKPSGVPDIAMPYLIKRVHGNTNNRTLIIKEFQLFWHSHCKEELGEGKTKDASSPERVKDSDDTAAQSDKPSMAKNSPSYVSRQQILHTLHGIAKRGMHKIGSERISCWYVKDDVLEKYNLLDLKLTVQCNSADKKAENVQQPSASPLNKSIKAFLCRE